MKTVSNIIGVIPPAPLLALAASGICWSFILTELAEPINNAAFTISAVLSCL